MIKLQDRVRLTENLPGRDLRCGQVGTVVEVLTPDVFVVEFSKKKGHASTTLALRSDQLTVLYHKSATP